MMRVTPKRSYGKKKRPKTIHVLTRKQANFVKAYQANGGNATAAAQNAYNTTTIGSAQAIGSALVAKLVETFPDVMDKVGLTDEYLAKTLFEASKANQTIITKAHGKLEVPDWQARVKSTEVSLKFKGKMPKDEMDVNVNFVVTRGANTLVHIDRTEPEQEGINTEHARLDAPSNEEPTG